MKTAQHFERPRHGSGFEIAVAEDALAQPRYLAVLEQRDQAAFAEFGNAEAD